MLKDIKLHGTSRVDKNTQEENLDVAIRIEEGKVSIYSFGEHIDLCRGPHVSRTGDLASLKFKLDRVSGAYWRGSEENKMLCRLYALAFRSSEELESFLYIREEAKKRDHRKLGEQLELFFFHSSAPGMAYWLPKGVILKNTLIHYWRQYHEERIGSEIKAILQIVKDFYSIFGLLDNVHLYLSTRPDDFMGDLATWDRAEEELRKILSTSEFKYGVKENDGAFYGPKIDIHLKDSLNREWQCGTIQLDFQLPRNFGLEYSEKDGSRRTPIVIHRVIYGSLERFIGIIIEHFSGRFPFWISPVQLRVLPVKNNQSDYPNEIIEKLASIYLQEPLRNNKLRFDIDSREESLSRRVRDAEVEKVPLLLIYGARDEKNRTVVMRNRGQDKLVNLDDLIKTIEQFSKMRTD